MQHITKAVPYLTSRALLLVALLVAGGASARTHSINNANNLNRLLSGQSVSGYTLADGDTIAIGANISMNAAYTIGKRVTIRSSGNTVRTISRTSNYAWTSFTVASQVTLENITFDGQSAEAGKLFDISSGASLTLGNGATVRNVLCGYGSSHSPIRVSAADATLTLNAGSLVSNCQNKYEHGGAIYNAGTVVMAGGRITGCKTTDSSHAGGAIYNAGTLTMSGGEIVSCTATGGGGGVNNAGGTFTMTGGEIVSCTATGYGGGVCNSSGTATFAGGTLTNCTANSTGGGAIYNAGTLNLSGATISGCAATQGAGGAIYNAGPATVAGGEITGCQAYNYGGAIYSIGSLSFSGDPSITANKAGRQGKTENNVRPDTDSLIRLVGDFSGTVGVTYPASVAEGQSFGVHVAGTGARNFFYDTAPSFKGQVSGSRLVWTDAAAVRYPDGNKTFAEVVAEAVSGGGVIELSADVTETLVVPAGYAVTIDLNGRKLTGGITARGSVTVTDSSQLKSGEVTGALVADGGAFALEHGTYAAEPPAAWLAADRVVLANADGTFSVTAVVQDDTAEQMALDTREGDVRVVNDPATDVLPITYASGMWVYGASEDASKTTGVYVVAAGTDSPIAVWHDGTNTVADAAASDGTYDYAAGAEIGEIGTRLRLFNGPYEAEFNWRQTCWGLVKAVHSNDNGQIIAYFKFPDPAFDVVQRTSVTNVYEIVLNDEMLAGLGFSRIDDVSGESIENHCNAMQPNGLRTWENMVTGANPTNDYVGALGPADPSKPDTLTVRMADAGMPNPQYGYRVLYDLRRATNGWRRIAGPQERPEFQIELHSDDISGEHNATGLYRIYTLLIPCSNLAITNEIPATNIIGVLKVNSPCTNTITAIPWRRLASAPERATDVTVAEVVAANNLVAGDRLYAYDNDTGLFYGWTMFESASGGVDWEAMLSVTSNGVTTADATVTTMPRGGAFWTVRAVPKAITRSGGVKPYFVCGQHESGPYTNAIFGGSYESPRSTILANPTPQPLAINDLSFAGTVGATDTIVVPTVSSDVPNVYHRNAANTEWGYSKQTVSRGRIRNTWITAGTLDPGVGFWYVRRVEGELKLVWPAWEE